MKVICNEFSVNSKDTCITHLEVDKVYHVFEIFFEPSRGIFYRIIKDHKEPGYVSMALFPSSCFTVVSTVVPSNWGIKIYSGGDVSISPVNWLRDGFYEEFYDSVESDEIYKIFEIERDIIMAEDPL